MRLWRWTALAGFLFSAQSGIAAADTLQEALAQAYRNNPDLRAARAALRVVDETVPQALSGYRPNLAVGASLGRETVDTNTTGQEDLDPRTLQLEVTQPLYRGGRTEAGVEQAESTVRAGRQDLRSIEQDVLLDAVTVYLNVLRDQARVELNEGNVEVLRQQLQATRDRFEVGELTRTDIAQAEARLSRAVADLTTAQADLAVQEATYRRIIGDSPEMLQEPPPLPELPATLSAARDISLAHNPDILTALFVEEAAGHEVDVVQGRLLPSVDLVGSLQRAEDVTFRDVNSDSAGLLARVTVPLYQSGRVHSEVRQAKQRRNQRRIEVEQARRVVLENATQAWETLQSARAVIESRQEQVRANEIALEGVRQEFNVGARTTLDVLDAEQELLDSRVALVTAQRDGYVAGYALLSAVGRLSAQSLGLAVPVYDPEEHYRRVRDKWWGWDIEDRSMRPESAAATSQ